MSVFEVIFLSLMLACNAYAVVMLRQACKFQGRAIDKLKQRVETLEVVLLKQTVSAREINTWRYPN